MCFDFYLLQQRRQGLVFGGRLILLFVFGRHVCDQLFQKCLSQVYITCLLIFFLFISFHPFSFFFFSYPPLIFYFPFQCLLPHIHRFPPSFKCSSPILPSASFPPLSSPSSCTIRLVSLPEQLQFKRRQSCFSPSCLWSGFTWRSADEASSRKTS